MWGLSLLASACLMSLTLSSPGCDRVPSRSHLREEGCLWTLGLGDAICHGGKVWQSGLCDSKSLQLSSFHLSGSGSVALRLEAVQDVQPLDTATQPCHLQSSSSETLSHRLDTGLEPSRPAPPPNSSST